MGDKVPSICDVHGLLSHLHVAWEHAVVKIRGHNAMYTAKHLKETRCLRRAHCKHV